MEANNTPKINTKGQAIIAAIKAGFAAGGKDQWDAPEFEAARQATADAGCCWDFDGWRNAAECVKEGMLGGVNFDIAAICEAIGAAWGDDEVIAWADAHDGTMGAAPAWTMGTYCGDVNAHAGLNKADADSDDEAVRDAYLAARDEAERIIDEAARAVWNSAKQ